MFGFTFEYPNVLKDIIISFQKYIFLQEITWQWSKSVVFLSSILKNLSIPQFHVSIFKGWIISSIVFIYSILSQFSRRIFFRKPEVHHKAVNMVRNLLTSHDFDSRFNETNLRSRVANLYLPLIAIIIDNFQKLFAWTAEGEVRIVGNANQNEHLNLILNVISDNLPNVSWTVECTMDLNVVYIFRFSMTTIDSEINLI